MKAVKPIGAAKMRAISAADFRPARLSANGVLREERMIVDQVTENFFGANGIRAIQSDAIIFGRAQILQAI